MLIWVFLFLLNITVSFYLAWRSMKNYRQRPHHFRTDSGVFLVQNPTLFNQELLENLMESAKSQGIIISFERLFKGNKNALVLFGPSGFLSAYKGPLLLLELDDYSQKFTQDTQGLLVWEMITRDLPQNPIHISVQDNLDLAPHEQFWWQIILQPSSGEYVIRAVVLAQNDKRAASLHSHLATQLESASLIPLPRTNKRAGMVGFYKDRALGQKDLLGHTDNLGAKEVLFLLKLFV